MNVRVTRKNGMCSFTLIPFMPTVFAICIQSSGEQAPPGRLRELGLFRLEKRGLRGMIMFFKYLKGCPMEEGTNLFTSASEGTTRPKGPKMQERRFRLVIRNKFFLVRMVHQWNRLLKELVDSSSLEIFKQKLHRHLLEML